MEPAQLHEFVHKLAKWTKKTAPEFWSSKAAAGDQFYWPANMKAPVITNSMFNGLVHAALPIQGGDWNRAQIVARDTIARYVQPEMDKLAAYHAETLEDAYLLYVGKDTSYLAAKTEMENFRLERKHLPATRGFVRWEIPIATATGHESHGMNPKEVEEILQHFGQSEIPINAASWRVSDDGTEVLVCLYSDGGAAKAKMINSLNSAGVLKEAAETDAYKLQYSDPAPLEREQVLPLGKTLAWFDSDSEEKLEATIKPVPPDDPRHREAVELHAKQVRAHEEYLPILTQAIKTFAATFLIREMKMISREEVPPPRSVKKRMKRMKGGDASKSPGSRMVEVIRIGKPLQHRNKSEESGKGGKWKVKTVVGPVVRYRQYVPAYDEYREYPEGKIIEPYVAGPADAPWSEKAKVYLME
ncbi:hypothetical protein ACFY1P_08065 [Streptomyces sp. NPDC001407]|uniref:hypothetical protein n=1 Tax=Streptomyces sp. NPDC001407 TaxID=3364573 RepID=UPI00368A9C7F